MTRPATSDRWRQKLAGIVNLDELTGFAEGSEEHFDLTTEDRQAIARRRVEIQKQQR